MILNFHRNGSPGASGRALFHLAGLTLGLCLLTGCEPGNPAAAGKGAPKGELPSRAVQVAPVKVQPLERVITVLGSLAALDQATLSVKVAGRIERMEVDLGSIVKQGSLIARIEPRDYELRLKQSEAQLAQVRARLGLKGAGEEDAVEVEQTSAVKAARAVLAEATQNRDRVARLVQQGVIPQSDLESAQAGFDVASSRHDSTMEEMRSLVAQLAQRRAEVEISRQQLADTEIYAPFDGAIQERRANRGEYLPAGSPVVTLVRTDPLRLRLEVPEREAARVRAGQTVRLTIEGDTNVFTGQISRLSPAIIEQNRMLIVEADVPSRGVLRPGLFASAELVTSTNEPGLVIPADALISFAGLEKVFTIKDGKAAEKLVATGRRRDGWIELTSGVKAEEPVIRQPGNLQAGTPVTVTDAAPVAKQAPSKKGSGKGGADRGTD